MKPQTSEEQEAIETLKARDEQSFLRQSGLPRPRWKTQEDQVPDVFLRSELFLRWWSHIEETYEAGTNFTLSRGDRETRMRVLAAMAMKARATRNKYPRDAYDWEKHHTESVNPVTDEKMTWPYTFKFMDVKTLGELRNDRDAAVRFDDDGIEETFEDVVVKPDFFFLTEIGHEWPSTWTAKLIEDLIYARVDQELPMVFSFEIEPRLLTGKNDAKVYETFRSIVTEWPGLALGVRND